MQRREENRSEPAPPESAGVTEVEETAALAQPSPAGSADEGAQPPPDAGETTAWPDAAAEASFLAEARERGEAPVAVKPPEEFVEETDPRSAPALETLVQRVSPEVRELLDDLFRARFVRVTRIPKKSLKS